MLKDVKANVTVLVDIRVIYLGQELDSWGPKGIVRGKMQREVEDATGIWSVIRPDDRGLPLKEIFFVHRAPTGVLRGFCDHLFQLLLQAFVGHFIF